MRTAHDKLEEPGSVERIGDKLVLCSDVHIRTMSDTRALLLLDGLSRLERPSVEWLVLNGDILDFCFGASRFFSAKFSPLGDMLSAIAADGVRVVFVQGNHEFSMNKLDWPGVQFVKSSGLSVRLSTGVTLAICHGDLLCAPWHYHLYQALTRSWLFNATAQLVPPAPLDRLALFLSKKSRASSNSKRLDHAKILDAAQRWLLASAADYGVFGHFHVPYCYPAQPQAGPRLVSVDSWDVPNFLTFDGDRFKRVHLQGVGQPFRVKHLG